MSNTLLLKRSSVANAAPSTGNLVLGELAINTNDGRLYTKIDPGVASIFELTQNQPIQVLGNVTGNSVNTGNGTTNLTLTLSTTGVTAGTYGGTTGAVSNIGVFTVDQYGRVTSASNVQISTSSLANGTSNIEIANSGNISITVAGTSNVTVFANTGAYVTGVLSVTGNATAANISTAGLISATGNISGGNITTAGTISATGNITSGNISVSGNVATGGILTNNYYYANGSPVDFQQAAGANGEIQFNLGDDFAASANLLFDSANSIFTVTGTSSVTGNVSAGNVNTGGLVSATGNVTGGNLVTAGNVTATGNVTGGNIATAGLITASGNVTGANFVTAGLITATGNVTGGNLVTAGNVTATGNVLSGNASITNLMSAGQITTAGNVLAGQQVSAAGNITAGNVSTAGLITATGNVTAGNFLTAGLVLATGNVTGGNVVTSGVVTTANINSTTSLTVTTGSGDINLWPTSGNIHLANTYINHVATPVQATDAATKQYVDDAVSTGITIHTPVYVESPTALAATYAQGGTTHTVTDITGNTTLTFSSAHSLNVNDQIYWNNTFNGITANTSYFVYSVPANTQITLTATYGGTQISNLTNGTGLSQVGRANPGVGATLTANTNGAANIDGVLVSASQRVLIYQQAAGLQNGVYVVTDTGNVSAPWVFTRSSDTNTYAPSSINGLDAGDYFYVQAGATGAGESYVLTAPTGEIILGLDSLTFTQFSASQVYSAGNGLTLTGTVFSVNVDNDTTAISGGNVVVKASANLVTPNIGNATGNSLSVTGNITGANVISTGLLTVTGNIVSGNVSATGNVTAAANVNAGNATITANVVGGNIITGGLMSATGNVTAGNLVTSATANVGTLVVNTFANILAATISTSNITGALRVAGGVGVTGNVYADGMYVLGDSVLTVNSTIDGGTY